MVHSNFGDEEAIVGTVGLDDSTRRRCSPRHSACCSGTFVVTELPRRQRRSSGATGRTAAVQSRPGSSGMRASADLGDGPVRSRLPDAVLWRADRCSGQLCSGAHETHELRLDGVEGHLVPRAQPGAERVAHLDHVTHADLLRAPRDYRDACRSAVSVKAV